MTPITPLPNEARSTLTYILGTRWGNESAIVKLDYLKDRAQRLLGVINTEHLPVSRCAAAAFGNLAKRKLPEYAHHFQTLASLKEEWPSNWKNSADMNAHVGSTLRDVEEAIAKESAQ